MIAFNPASLRSRQVPLFQLAVIALVALTVARLVGLHASAVDLYYDEAQYWVWSRDLAFGYFSKPPLLAWIIAASQPICGSTEDCVRAASPLFYLATSLMIYAVADKLYGRDAAFWSALTFALLPGVCFSARIISTDVPLLFFWTAALLAYVQLLRAPDWRWALALGVALGLGLLAKYAMIYFVLGAVCAGAIDRDARALLLRPQTWVAFLVAIIILSPNLYWNLANSFVTFKHTGGNISGKGLHFRPLDALSFVGSQFAVAGPFVFASFLAILFRVRLADLRQKDRLMLAFALPPLALVTALSFFRGANPNWAAPALISATILVVAWWTVTGRWRWVVASLAIGVATQTAMLIGDAYADRISVPALGRKADIYERTLGWRALGENVARLAQTQGAPTVAAEGRAEVAVLTYYLRTEPRAVRAWHTNGAAHNQFDLTQRLSDSAAEPVLFVTGCPNIPRLASYFAKVARLPNIVAKSGPHSERDYYAFKLEHRRRPLGALAPCKDGAG